MKVAISGLSGVGSSTTAKLVSERLNLPMTNFTFRQLAVEKGMSFEELQTLAASEPEVDFELDRRLISFINENPNCIAATDISCWLDNPGVYTLLGLDKGPSFDLKIWLEAPLEVRAARMQAREKGSIEDIIAYNHQRDIDNRERYLNLYGIDIFSREGIDWVFETSDHNLNEVVEAVCQKIEGLQA